jgi:hypothetical protein
MKHVSRRGLLKTVGAGALVPLVPTVVVAQTTAPTLVTNLRATHRADSTPKFDRVVIDLSGAVPAEVQWEYVPKLIADGSGFEVPIEGSVKYQITLRGVQAHTDAGGSTLPQRTITPRLPIVRQVKLFSDFEGIVLVGIGLSCETRTRTLLINDRARNTVRAVIDFIIL